MANRLFQSVIYQMQGALGKRKAGVLDDAGVVVACSEVTTIGEKFANFNVTLKDSGDAVEWNGMAIKRLNVRERGEFYVFCDGYDESGIGFCGIIAVALSQLKQFYDEKYDKLGFIKNVLTDNIMTGDIHIKAKALHIAPDTPRIVFLIRVPSEDYSAHEVIKNLFPDRTKDYVVSLNEVDAALVKEVRNEADSDADKIALNIYNTLCAETFTSAHIGIGSVAANISQIAASYKNAGVALDVGKVFDGERTIINYDNLGIGRLIYQLPTKLCEMFLSEVFKKNPIDVLDNETIVTIQKFFENNLNVSEASRQLFVHRNTLVYRLDKILKLTGLDLRLFDDAIVFKVAMMVNKYLHSDSVNI